MGFILFLLASSFATILAAISFFILLNALLKPSAIALISKGPTMSQGRTMGIAESYLSLGRTIGPLWAGTLFDIYISYPFISGMLIFFLLFIGSQKKGRKPALKAAVERNSNNLRHP